MLRRNFDTIICFKNFEIINLNYSEDFTVVQGNDDLVSQVHKSKGCVIVNGLTNVDYYNLLTLEIDSPVKLFGYFESIDDQGQERVYPNAEHSECSDYMLFSDCYLIPNSFDGDIKSLDDISSSVVTSFLKRPFALSEYKKALFLDRDGVINIDHGYVHEISKLDFVPGVLDLLKLAQTRDILKLVVTNQAGVARGYYSEQQVDIFHAQLSNRLSEQGIEINDFQIAPHHFGNGVNTYKKYSFRRKPHPGMVLKHMFKHPVALNKSFMIGDRASDVLNLSQLKYILLKGKYDIDEVPTSVKLFNDMVEVKEYLISLDFLQGH